MIILTQVQFPPTTYGYSITPKVVGEWGLMNLKFEFFPAFFSIYNFSVKFIILLR